MSQVKRIKPALSKGTRDFLPSEVAKRNYIFNTIKSVFRKYGFEEIETPAIERLETLTGKYGEEGDKLLFKILNSGDYLKDAPADLLSAKNSSAITQHIAEKGLRYDLTVPLARYVVQHQENLAFPFKRFHIGPVWRADRPQKGRYQEFYQCDADVIGSTSLLNEVELTKIYVEVFERLGIAVTIRINNRKILSGLGEKLAELVKGDQGIYPKREHEIEQTVSAVIYAISIFITALDKADKIGIDGVKAELLSKGFPSSAIDKFDGILNMKGDNLSQFKRLKEEFAEFPIVLEGINELNQVIALANTKNVTFDTLLARGLNYYTGIIWEVVCNDVQMGSIASGGRYDNLTEMFGGQNMSGVGISFGIERIYDVMEELNLFPETISQGVQVLFVPRDADAEEFTFKQVQALRDAGIPAEIYLGNVKKQKQYTYVEQKNISFIVEVGADEVASQKFRLRNAKTRDTQNDLALQQIIQLLTNPA